ncbi:hypothetical protein H1R20_g15199, partial [Candolleomyces eurysporus]
MIGPSREGNATKYTTSTLLIVSTNIIVTTLITFRLLRARRTLAKVLPSADVRVYTGVIAILIESAAPLAISGILVVAINLGPASARSYSSGGIIVCCALFNGLFFSFCALSPHMIIFRVTTGRSFTKFPSVRDGVVTNPIQFAHQTAESSFFQSMLNREFGRNGDADTEQGLNFSINEPTQTRMSIIHIAQEKRNDGDILKVG